MQQKVKFYLLLHFVFREISLFALFQVPKLFEQVITLSPLDLSSSRWKYFFLVTQVVFYLSLTAIARHPKVI